MIKVCVLGSPPALIIGYKGISVLPIHLYPSLFFFWPLCSRHWTFLMLHSTCYPALCFPTLHLPCHLIGPATSSIFFTIFFLKLLTKCSPGLMLCEAVASCASPFCQGHPGPYPSSVWSSCKVLAGLVECRVARGVERGQKGNWSRGRGRDRQMGGVGSFYEAQAWQISSWKMAWIGIDPCLRTAGPVITKQCDMLYNHIT